MKEPIRIAMIMGKMIGGGVESVVMNYYRHIDKSKFQFDFIIDEDSTVVPEDEILEFGGRIFKIPPYQKLVSYRTALKQLFDTNNYQIIHSHINALSVFPLGVAKKCNIPIRIAHNHSTAAPGEYKKNVMKYALRLFAKKNPTHFMSPTYYAGEWLFGKKIADEKLFILKNAIEVEKFEFDPLIRKKIRQELGYSDDDFVVGNVGRCVWQKNQKFLIDIFKHFAEINGHARLVIIGEGLLKKELQEYVTTLNVSDKVSFISIVNNVADYYQGMDCFLFPSRYEGLGMVAVEAQISGLPILSSSKVPMEASISDFFYQVDVGESPIIWTKKLSASLEDYDDKYDCRMNLRVSANEYDIKKQVRNLEAFYSKVLCDFELMGRTSNA